MTNQMKYNYNYITLFKDSNKGRSTNRMNPICAPGFVTRSLSIKGAIGNPSFFSLSDWNIHIDNAHPINVRIDFITPMKTKRISRNTYYIPGESILLEDTQPMLRISLLVDTHLKCHKLWSKSFLKMWCGLLIGNQNCRFWL